MAEFEVEPGIDTSTLNPGTILLIRTVNSLYVMELLGKGMVEISGGNYFRTPTKVYFSGSTWGSSMIRLGFIGEGLYMEFAAGDESHPVTTSGVVSVRIIQPIGWSYPLSWVAESL